jgi:hypothetical protein
MPADRPAASRPATSGGIVEVLGLLIGSGVVNVSRRPAAARSPRTCVPHEFPERVGVGGPAVQLFLGCPPAFGSGPEKRLRGWCQPRDQASMAPGNPSGSPRRPGLHSTTAARSGERDRDVASGGDGGTGRGRGQAEGARRPPEHPARRRRTRARGAPAATSASIPGSAAPRCFPAAPAGFSRRPGQRR